MYIPLHDNVLIKPQTEKKQTPGGIVLPDNARMGDDMRRGEVLAVGQGRYNDKGELTPVAVAVGSVVLFSSHLRYQPFKDDDGNELYIVPERELIATVE